MARLEEKTALITGCNRGIGFSTAEIFAKHGINLICAIRKGHSDFENKAHEWAKSYSISVSIYYVDLLEEDSIKSLFSELHKTKQRVDILVNNAGIPAGGFMLMTPISKIKEVFQVNFFSQVMITQYVAKMMMRQKGGTIINMSSVVAFDNLAGWTAYGSSKSALASFTKTVARELAPFNIRVNAVAPGLIDTEMGGDMDDKTQKEMLFRCDMKRKGNPEEIANLILFLASSESSYITGQIIRADGGM